MKIQQNPTDIIFYIVGLFFIPRGRIGRIDFTLGITIMVMLTNFILWRPLKDMPLGTLQQKLQLENESWYADLKLDHLKTLWASISHPTSDHNISQGFLLIAAILLWCSASLAIKRLHDMDSKASILFLVLIPFVNFMITPFFLAAFLFLPGTPGPNQFGPSRKPFQAFKIK